MSKSEFVENVTKRAEIKSELTKKDATALVDAVFAEITNEVAKGNKVSFVGFGSFESRKRAARKGRNPQTGAEIEIPASTVPGFRAGKAFKDAVK